MESKLTDIAGVCYMTDDLGMVLGSVARSAPDLLWHAHFGRYPDAIEHARFVDEVQAKAWLLSRSWNAPK
jgi:hypothetical protein